MAHKAKTLPLIHPAFRAAAGILRVLPRLAGAARFSAGAVRARRKALQPFLLALAASLFYLPTLWAATPAGITLTNTATANYRIGAAAFSNTAAATVVTDATIRFMAATPGGTATPVGTSQCASNGAIGGPFDLIRRGVATGNLTLAPTTSYGSGQTAYLEVVDHWANRDPAAVETVAVTVSSSAPADSEVLLLTETGPDSGVFTGAIKTTRAAVAHNDCKLSSHVNNSIRADYVFQHGTAGTASSTTTAAALVDPYGTVFDTANGRAEDGATVTLIDAGSGLPATVLCDDGVQASPNPVVTGSTFAACGGTVALPPGGYRFPLINPGTYLLRVAGPPGYTFASSVPASVLAAAPATAGYVVSAASYGAPFTVAAGAPAIRIDLPVDPSGTNLQIAKTAGRSVVGEGDYVPYTLTIENESTVAAAANVQIADRLPQGFRYQAGSARLNGAAQADPMVSADGRTLTFALGAIPAAGTVALGYVAQVSAGAPTGKAENVAVSVGGLTSNTARASVVVREDLMRSRAILMGRVIIGSCDGRADNDRDGLQNARIVLEDGTSILTDQEGRWHADNIRPGTHVVQLDLDSLSDDYEVATCEKNARFAGRNYSQFVNVRGGSLWRADFHVQRKAVKEMRLTQKLAAQRDGGLVRVSMQLRGESDVRQASSTFMLPQGVTLVEGSARLDGDATAALENSDGMLVLRLPEQQGEWAHALTFDVRPAGPEPVRLAAMARFVAPSASQGVNLPRAELVVEQQPVETENSALIPTPVPHHESANVPGAQERGERTVRLDGDATPQPVKADSRAQLVEQLPYDAAWLGAAEPGTEWLHPQESFLPALPAIKAAVKLAPGQRATLRLNGKEVSPLYYDGEESNAAHTVALATWRGIHINDGDNALEMIVTDQAGKEVLRQSRNIRYTVAPDRVELVPEHSRLVADGKTRPIIALRFLDKDGYKMRRGVNGEFLLNSPYESMSRLEAMQRDPLGAKIDGKPRYEIGADGIALVELAPTTQSGEAVLNFTFDNGRKQELRTWLEAGQRDWVLVGFGEGTLGHKQLSGNMAALQEAGADGQLFDGDRLAFYAKGTVKGEYLLTMAYDTAKQQSNGSSTPASLRQAINPNQYYTLYADAAQPYFDAASASKLYLKIERKQFYALFGDYDTGLTVTEFARYSRSVNGLKSEYRGEKAGYNAFATTTTQAYIKDEIPGDGTSGLYRLTRRNIVANSDKIRIETRDRFQSQIVVSTQTLTRYLDYDIDYDNGTLFFKQPVTARDAAFNPVYIVAEYESGDPRDKNLTAGGRASFKPVDQLEIGATLVHDGTQGANGDLGGLDGAWQVDDKTRVQAEIARSQRDLAGLQLDGSAWKAELNRHEDGLDGRLYVREQAGGFGLGQQANSETGTRKFGGEARLKLSETAQGQVQAYRQETLGGNDTLRNVLDGRINHTLGSLTSYYGGRYANDKDSLGATHSSSQVLAGAGYTFDRLTLRAATENGLGKSASTDFLDRISVGADYKLTEQTKLFVEQEHARGEKVSTAMTRAGLSTQPWTGAAMSASLGNQSSLDSGRMYANLGLVQRWQINEFWQADFGMDRAQTLRSTSAAPLNANVAPPYGSLSGDYTAASLGLNYNDTVWGANSRVERRVSAIDNKINALFGFQRNLDAGRVLASGLGYTVSQSAVSQSRHLDARLSFASRPWDSAWAWLDRLDYVEERSADASGGSHARKLVNNYNANWSSGNGAQVALQYGAKYVLDTINGADYGGYTDLVGLEMRRDLGRDWDVGAHASMLHSWSAGARRYGLGASLGYQLVDNAWLVVGYNLLGYGDRDFSGAAYRAQGPYVTLRMKIDQDTFKLNDNNGGLLARNP
jgi:uncharacterized repeat protein (TIGR01451 family)